MISASRFDKDYNKSAQIELISEALSKAKYVKKVRSLETQKSGIKRTSVFLKKHLGSGEGATLLAEVEAVLAQTESDIDDLLDGSKEAPLHLNCPISMVVLALM